MYLVNQITADPYQRRTLVLDDGTTFTLTMYFAPMQLCWFITSFIYGDFELNGFRITNNPNMLYQWRNKLPFGLACISNAGREPQLQQDFSSGASKLYVLSEAEVLEYVEFLERG